MPPMTIRSIRSADPTDIPAIVAINTAGRPGVYPLTPETMAATLTAAPYVMVTELDGRVAGYMIGYTAGDVCEGGEFAWFQARMPSFLYIDQIAVAPHARRMRVGARLYAHAASHARAYAIPALVCDINLDPPNPASLRFHARLGFQEVAVITTHDGRTVSLQRKDLLERHRA